MTGKISTKKTKPRKLSRREEIGLLALGLEDVQNGDSNGDKTVPPVHRRTDCPQNTQNGSNRQNFPKLR